MAVICDGHPAFELWCASPSTGPRSVENAINRDRLCMTSFEVTILDLVWLGQVGLSAENKSCWDLLSLMQTAGKLIEVLDGFHGHPRLLQ